jgi:hypothetical protein
MDSFDSAFRFADVVGKAAAQHRAGGGAASRPGAAPAAAPAAAQHHVDEGAPDEFEGGAAG